MRPVILVSSTLLACVSVASAFLTVTPPWMDPSQSHRFTVTHSSSSSQHFRSTFFLSSSSSSPNKSSQLLSLSSSSEEDDQEDELLLLQDLKSRPARDLKRALEDRNVSTLDLFEKEQLIQRLLGVLRSESSSSKKESTTSTSSTSKNNSNDSNNVIETPLKLLSMRSNVNVKDSNRPKEEGLQMDLSDQPFATMVLEVQHHPRPFSLRLMVDTACSGVVLTPQAVQRHGLSILDTSVTSTGAAGTAEQTKLTQLTRFTVAENPQRSFGPLPAAVQDIGSLPEAIEGIVGLSFLNQFDTVELDYQNEVLRLFPSSPSPASVPSNLKVATEANLKLLGSMGIYVVDVHLGGRGPVSMIVDSGGSNTFLSWKGVADLGLRRDSPAVQRIVDHNMGAMGNTGAVFDLTHRIFVSSWLQLGSQSTSSPEGLSLAGDARLSIDIGDIPLLQMLANQNVGGILGLDVFSRCALVRYKLQGAQKVVTLYVHGDSEQS